MSYGKNNNNDIKGNLLNKLLNKSHKSYIIKSFSVGQEDLPTLALFEELVHREKTHFSELVVRALEEYVRRHHPGNPQLPLTKFVSPDQPRGIESCPSVFKVVLGNRTISVTEYNLRQVDQQWRDLRPKSKQTWIRILKQINHPTAWEILKYAGREVKD